MLRNHPLARLLVCLIAVAACPSSAEAEDFNFEIPLEINIATAGASRINVFIDCIVLSRIDPDGSFSARDIVASESEAVAIDPSTGVLNTTVRLSFDADISIRAPTARHYTCSIGQVGYSFGSDVAGIALNTESLEEDYARLTGFPLTRVVRSVSGDLPRAD